MTAQVVDWTRREEPAGPAAALWQDAIDDRPGLPVRLASMAAELRLIAGNYPVTALGAAALGDAVEQAQVIREMAHALTAILAGEVEQRGLAGEQGLSRNDWVTAHSPNLEGGQSAAVTAVGAALGEERWRELARKVRTGVATVDKAAVIVRFFNDVRNVADPVAVHEVVTSMVEHAEDFSLKQLRQLIAQARAALRPPKDVEDDAARMRAGRSLTKVGQSAGMTEYRLRLDPEGAAIVDAAIDPLARPRPDLDWDAYRQPAERSRPCPHVEDRDCVGPCACDPRCECRADCATPATKRDPRHAPTRCADALLELIGRAVAAPEGVTRTPRTQLVVTMSLEALLAALRASGRLDDAGTANRADGTATGIADNGQVLSAGAIRRLACEAAIIPAVLGTGSTVLDLGYTERYFTPAQRRALIIRDKGCTYPGCTIPAQWCEAHHLTHWCHGGPTDTSNGALLCGRHHTIVHQPELIATVTSFGVTWHLPEHHQ